VNDKDYKKVLDKLSPSFCSAKWYNATIWLGSGQTTSCHHPPAHQISDDVVNNPKLLHNTKEKKHDRELMVRGERPKGCDYCWKVMDMETDAVPDRVYKSKIYDWSENLTAYKTNPQQDVDLKTLEISFDRTCNFACSYCNPAFSTTWAKDIKENGPYEGLVTDGRNHFTHTHAASQPFKVGEPNQYVDAFFKWWESDLKGSLQELRITGGEPTMSQDFWKLLDMIYADYKNSADSVFKYPPISMNSNLGCSDVLFNRLINDYVINFGTLYTSCEATDAHAEYIRDGLDYDQWTSRLDALLADGTFNDVSVMCTVNALCLWTLTDMLDHLIMLRQKHWIVGKQPSFTLNILRFPSFQSCLVLPEEIRSTRRAALGGWLMKQDPKLLHAHEIDHIERLIDYLREPAPIDVEARQHDFKQFYTQYDIRRGKLFEETFPEELVTWYKTL